VYLGKIALMKFLHSLEQLLQNNTGEYIDTGHNIEKESNKSNELQHVKYN
jgi:hypothetical protein